MSVEFLDLSVEAVRLLFLGAFPIIIAVALGGTIVAALQSATTIQEPALGYAVRLIVLVGVLYFTLADTLVGLKQLTELALR